MNKIVRKAKNLTKCILSFEKKKTPLEQLSKHERVTSVGVGCNRRIRAYCHHIITAHA